VTEKDIYEIYIIPYLDKVKDGRATEEEVKLMPEILKIALEYFA